MAGSTVTVTMQRFVVDWLAYVPISSLCVRYTVNHDEVVRLRRSLGLPPRTDRSRRAKPPRSPAPTREEDEASGASCDLAPAVAKRVAELRRGINGPVIHGTYVRLDRGVVPFRLPVVTDWRDYVYGEGARGRVAIEGSENTPGGDAVPDR